MDALTSICKLITQSHIEHPFMFRNRFKALNDNNLARRKNEFDRAETIRSYNCSNFTKDIGRIMEYYVTQLLPDDGKIKID